MALIVFLSGVLWLVVTADHVRNDRETGYLHHVWEREGSLWPGSVSYSQHPAPFWPRYWRRLLHQPWPGSYVCDPREGYQRFARCAVTKAGPPMPGTGNFRTPSRIDTETLRREFRDWQRRMGLDSAYRKEYVPRHWKKLNDDEWVNDYR